jgi:hypothetical protein
MNWKLFSFMPNIHKDGGKYYEQYPKELGYCNKKIDEKSPTHLSMWKMNGAKVS